MKNLSIKVLTDTEEIASGLRSHIGEITIGDYKETFEMPVEYWTRQDYQKQWKEGLERITKEPVSCLVMRVEGYRNRLVQIDWWLLYREKNKIFIRNQLLISDNLKKQVYGEFTPESCYNFIHKRRKKKNVAEWTVEI